MNTSSRPRSCAAALFLTVFLSILCSSPVFASAVSITSCRLLSARQLQVTATANPGEIQGNKCYLFALPFSGGSAGSSVKPLQARPVAGKLQFTVSFKADDLQNILYGRYAVCQYYGGKYKVVSNYRFLSNPSLAAEYHYAFPTASSKKGLAVAASMLPDAAELNIQHAAINMVFTEMLAGSGEKNKSHSYSYTYRGKKYWFRKSLINHYDKQLTALKETGTVVTAILLLGYRSDLKYLIPPAGRQTGHNFYAWNVNDQKARETFEACLSYLSRRYASASAPHGRIVNWIVGNEVADYRSWNYGGELSLQQYAALYAGAFRLTYTAVSSVYANARVYISLDHRWNTTWNHSFTGRAMLEAFASVLQSSGNIPWNLAYHPYSSPLHETKFWENKDQMLRASITSPIINMGNLSILTNYIRTKYGSGTRIILSEQGFTSVRNKVKEENVQSAAIAYSYLLTEEDDMVDSFIMNRHVDHIAETSAGLYLGLWNNNATEWASTKKQSWTTFKYMDTNLSETVTSQALKVIGAKSWNELIPRYSGKLYSKTSITQGQLKTLKSYKKKKALASSWKAWGAAASCKKKSGKLTVKRKSGENANLQWGVTQSFSKGVNLSQYSLCSTVKVTGAKKGKARIRVRIYSGQSRYECFCDIPCGKNVKLGTALKAWSGAKKITKIQILAEPVSGGWKSGSKIVMTVPVLG